MSPQAPDVQPTHLESSEATRVLNEYEQLVPSLASEIRRLGMRMKTMRGAGIPDRKTYENLRTQVITSLERTKDLQQRLNAIAGQETDVSPAAVREAYRVRTDHMEELEAAEDAFREVLMEDVQWHDTRTETGKYGHREGYYGAQEDVRTLPLELYDERVEGLIHEVGSLESAFEQFALPSGLTRTKLESFHEGLTAAYEQLLELDEQTSDFEQSKERNALLFLIRQLKERYPLSMEEVTPERLKDAFQMQQRVKADYTAVSHRLPDERRRYYRTRIAQLSAAVDRVAEDAWRAVVPQTAIPPTPPPPEPPLLDELATRMHVQLAMTRAALAAHPITDAVLTATRRKRGVLGTLVSALRLK